MARLLLAFLAGAAVALATLYAALWLLTVQRTVTAAAIEAQRARIAAEQVAGALGAPRPARPAPQPMGDL